MRKVTFSDTKTKIQHLFGVDSMVTLETSQVTTGINKYARLAWERAKWPDICPTEQRTVNGRVTSVTVTAGGTGYTGTPTVAFSGGGGTGAAATAVVTYEVVTSVIMTSYPNELPFTLTANGGLLVGKDDADPVWVHYRKRFSEYATDAEDLPYLFQQYLVHGTYADLLFAEGQHDKGNNALNLAEQLILNELDKVERQQSQENHVRVLTHVGQQARI